MPARIAPIINASRPEAGRRARAFQQGAARMDDLETWKKLAREHRGVTQELAAFIAGLKPGDIPGQTRDILGHALVDALGCGLYGLTTPRGRVMAEFAREPQGPAQPPPGGRRPPARAAHPPRAP